MNFISEKLIHFERVLRMNIKDGSEELPVCINEILTWIHNFLILKILLQTLFLRKSEREKNCSISTAFKRINYRILFNVFL